MRPVSQLAFFLGCLTLFLLGENTASSNPANTVGASRYAAKVISIDRLAGEIVAIEGLLLDAPFVELANEGSRNIDDCMQFLSESGHSPQQRTIALLSMHKLGVHDYVIFLRKLADLFDKGLVSRNELGNAVFPGYAFSTVLVEDYGDGDVRSSLKEIAAREGIRPATKSAIESALSGRALEDLISFRRNCCSAGRAN